MSDLRKYLENQLEDPEFREEWEKGAAESEVMRALISARIERNMTQEELAAKSGIRQSNISRIERGASSPTINTLQALARGMGKQLHIEFR